MKKSMSALAMFGIAAALAACGADELRTRASASISDPQALPRTPASTSIAEPQTFVCHAAVRPSVQVKPESLEEIRMSEPGDRSISSGAFRFRVLYWDDGRYGGRALATYVYSTSTGKLIEQSLFQLDSQTGPVNQFGGGSGFTGGRYVYAPDSDAELQYWCRSS